MGEREVGEEGEGGRVKEGEEGESTNHKNSTQFILQSPPSQDLA